MRHSSPLDLVRDGPSAREWRTQQARGECPPPSRRPTKSKHKHDLSDVPSAVQLPSEPPIFFRSLTAEREDSPAPRTRSFLRSWPAHPPIASRYRRLSQRQPPRPAPARPSIAVLATAPSGPSQIPPNTTMWARRTRVSTPGPSPPALGVTLVSYAVFLQASLGGTV